MDQENAEQIEESIDRSTLAPAAFIKQVATAVKERLSTRISPLNTEVRSRLAKFWYGPDGSVHFELWLHDNTAQLEIGFHSEASAERNRALYVALDKCLMEIQKELGTSIWLEEWDRGWIRLYETQRLWPLDDVRVEEVAGRLSEVIRAIQPIYEAIAPSLVSVRSPTLQERR